MTDPGPYLMRIHAPEWIESLDIDLTKNPALMDMMDRLHALTEGTEYFADFHSGNHCLYLEDGEGFEILVAPTDPRKPESFERAIGLLERVLKTCLVPHG